VRLGQVLLVIRLFGVGGGEAGLDLQRLLELLQRLLAPTQAALYDAQVEVRPCQFLPVSGLLGMGGY
jgi:hypothetical protein